MTLLILFLPLFFITYTFCIGRRLGASGSLFLSCFVSLVQMFAAFFLYVECFVLKATLIYKLRLFTVFGGYDFSFGFLVDRLSASMILIVTVISFAVQVYSIEYLKDDPHRTRFSIYLQLFTFFMLMLLVSPNYFQLFLGWEGVGLTSYLLVNFWYTRVQANKSSLKALFVNRVGDFFYMFGLFFCLIEFRTTDFTIIVANLSSECDFSAQLICLFFIFAAAAKSAQFGLHTWLPDAMEGPTPVSALIHAATMVTAGVFLMLRVAPILCLYEMPSIVLVYLGSITAFFAATTAAAQYDLKRVIAYSTCSQLGYMMAAVGVGVYDTCLYHLINHAFFKALLFLTAGIIIHALNNEQDMRYYGGLISLLPYAYVLMFIGNLGLTGFPFLSGYYSKDNLLEMVLTSANPLPYFLLVLTAGITAFYSVRTTYLIFAETPRFSLNSTTHLNDGAYLLLVPTLSLAFLTIFHGFVVRDMYLGLGSTLYPEIPFSPYLTEFSLNTGEKLIPLISSLVGAICGILIFYGLNSSPKLLLFLNKRWFVDYLDTYLLRFSFYKFYKFFTSVERGHNEGIPSGLSNLYTRLVTTYLSVFLAVLVITFTLLLVYCLGNPIVLPLTYAYRVQQKKHRKYT